ncbi:MAG TPA: hypothetical protein VK034_31375, partial [Enhygromyxa sp.]|nr:hypothetical protein [Enhygromyxa sp.]
MLGRIIAFTIGLLVLSWSSVALADVTVKLSPGVTKALQEAAGQPKSGDPVPAAEDDINEGINHALKELAKHPTDPRVREAAKRLLDSGQTIR